MERIWDILQIDRGADRGEIKRAYARLSKEIHPEERPEEFQRLYEAYHKALQYVSSREERNGEVQKAGAMPETELKEQERPDAEKQLKIQGGSDAEKQNRYEEFGLPVKDAQKEQLRLKKIVRFLADWTDKIILWEQTGVFWTESWKAYLRSETFGEFMWSPIVLEELAEDVLKYFQKEEEVLLFLSELYGFEISGTENGNERGLLVYKGLHPAYIEKEKRQKIQTEWLRIEKVRYFQSCWKKQIFVWANKGSFLSEDWKAYLESADFQEIMWSPDVLETVTKGLAWYCEQRPERVEEGLAYTEIKQKMMLFFWDLYHFEVTEEENYKGDSLLLYKKLYPAYVNRIRQRSYEANKKKILKKERWRVWRIILTWLLLFALVILGVLALRFIPPDVIPPDVIPPDVIDAALLIAIAVVAAVMLFVLEHKRTK